MHKIYLYVLCMMTPSLAFALDFSLAGKSVKDIILYGVDLLNVLNPILLTLAFIVFFWGLSKFILHAGSDTENKKGRDYMLWGILALFILLTAQAIIRLASNELEFGGNTSPSGVLLPTR